MTRQTSEGASWDSRLELVGGVGDCRIGGSVEDVGDANQGDLCLMSSVSEAGDHHAVALTIDDGQSINVGILHVEARLGHHRRPWSRSFSRIRWPWPVVPTICRPLSVSMWR